MCFFLTVPIGCRSSSSNGLEQLYSDARQKLERGYLAPAQGKAEQGFRESARDPIWNWKFRVLEAEILQWRTRNQQVLDLLTVQPPRELTSGEFAVRAKAAQGLALGYLQREEEAENEFKQADEIAARSAPDLQCLIALYRGNLAHHNKQFALAEKPYRESLRLARQESQPFVEAQALLGIGALSANFGHFDEGVESNWKAINFARSHRYDLDEAIALGNLAWNYLHLGDLDNAISYFFEEGKVLDTLRQEHIRGLLLTSLGDTYFAQRNYQAARDSYVKALDLFKEMQAEKRTDEKIKIEENLNHVAEVNLAIGNLSEAEVYFQEAEALDAKFPATVLTSAKIAAARRHIPEAARLFQHLTDASAKNAFVTWNPDAEVDNRFVRWEAEAGLANLYAAEHQNSRAEQQFQNLISQVEVTRSRLHVDENRLAFSSHAGRYYDDYVRFLADSGQQRKAFQVAEFSRARTLAGGVGMPAPRYPSDLKIKTVQAYLAKSNKMLLAYWLAPDRSFLWLISPTHFNLFNLPSESEIERQAADYSKVLATDGEDKLREAESLYQMLIAPAQKFISPGANLVIIPDGQLDRLNFEALRVPGASPHYWIEDVELEVAGSTSVLINSKLGGAQAARKLLLIGNPVEASSDYPVLRHAAEEIDKVKNHFTANQEIVISGNAATPAVYANSHPDRFDLIHFVTHGTAHELRPLESAIILSPGSDQSFKLYAGKIVGIPIKAQMVTISACYGAGKRAYSGEGLVGLAWAFLKAGAHRVVAGLWEVDDRASVQLMDDFYTSLQQGKSPSAALRSAKLNMVKSKNAYSRPYYWASLQLYTGS